MKRDNKKIKKTFSNQYRFFFFTHKNIQIQFEDIYLVSLKYFFNFDQPVTIFYRNSTLLSKKFSCSRNDILTKKYYIPNLFLSLSFCLIPLLCISRTFLSKESYVIYRRKTSVHSHIYLYPQVHQS